MMIIASNNHYNNYIEQLAPSDPVSCSASH